MRAGISEPTRPTRPGTPIVSLIVTTGPFSVSVLGPDKFSRLVLDAVDLGRHLTVHDRTGLIH